MPLVCLFIYALCLALCLPTLFPSLSLLFFAPFLILSFYRCTLPVCLWWALLCGFIMDLFSSDTRLGAYAANYCFTTFCLYRYQFHFFEDRLSTLSIMTFGFTFFSILLQILTLFFTHPSFKLHWGWLQRDLLLNPLENALYAGLAFTLPMCIVHYIKKQLFAFTKRRRL